MFSPRRMLYLAAGMIVEMADFGIDRLLLFQSVPFVEGSSNR